MAQMKEKVDVNALMDDFEASYSKALETANSSPDFTNLPAGRYNVYFEALVFVKGGVQARFKVTDGSYADHLQSVYYSMKSEFGQANLIRLVRNFGFFPEIPLNREAWFTFMEQVAEHPFKCAIEIKHNVDKKDKSKVYINCVVLSVTGEIKEPTQTKIPDADTQDEKALDALTEKKPVKKKEEKADRNMDELIEIANACGIEIDFDDFNTYEDLFAEIRQYSVPSDDLSDEIREKIAQNNLNEIIEF